MDNRFRELDGFTPSKKYLELVALSDRRKVELNLVGYNYWKLSKQNLREKFGFELHHIIPNYRQTSKSPSERKVSENIAVLTIREHIIAHKELVDFEKGVFKYKAKAAFLLQTNRNIEYLEGAELSEDILDSLEKSRLSYYGSAEHIQGSKKAGNIAGLKRKERMKNDAEFRKKILDSLTSSREEASKNRSIGLNNRMPWERSDILFGDSKLYQKQAWKFFDSIYEGVVVYNLSYKVLSKILSVPINRLSNIVRNLRENSYNKPFKESEFYSSFMKDFEPTLDKFHEDLEYFGNKEIPWTHHKPTKSMILAEIGFKAMVNSLDNGYEMKRAEFTRVVGSTTSETYKLFELLQGVLDSGVYKLEDVWWYKYLHRVYKYHSKTKEYRSLLYLQQKTAMMSG